MSYGSGYACSNWSAASPQRLAVDVFFDEPSRTRQEFADECDINVLMRRFEATGVVSHVNQREPMYLDLSEGIPDLREALDLVREADASFMSLPARVRAEFDNDPVRFVEYCGDPANRDRLIEWGFIDKPLDPPVSPAVEPPSP